MTQLNDLICEVIDALDPHHENYGRFVVWKKGCYAIGLGHYTFFDACNKRIWQPQGKVKIYSVKYAKRFPRDEILFRLLLSLICFEGKWLRFKDNDGQRYGRFIAQVDQNYLFDAIEDLNRFYFIHEDYIKQKKLKDIQWGAENKEIFKDFWLGLINSETAQLSESSAISGSVKSKKELSSPEKIERQINSDLFQKTYTNLKSNDASNSFANSKRRNTVDKNDKSLRVWIQKATLWISVTFLVPILATLTHIELKNFITEHQDSIIRRLINNYQNR